MSRSVRTRRRRLTAPRRRQDQPTVEWDHADRSPEPIVLTGPPTTAPDSPPDADPDVGPLARPAAEAGASLRLSRAAAELLLRLPLLSRLDRRVAPLIDQGRLDQTDALAGLLRYGVMGALATGVYFAVAVGLHQTGLGPNTTSAIAIAISVLVSFVIQSRVTFQTGRLDPAEAARFVVVGLIGLTVSRVVIGTVHLRAGQPFWVAALVVCLIVPITNFTAMNFWVFAGGRGHART